VYKKAKFAVCQLLNPNIFLSAVEISLMTYCIKGINIEYCKDLERIRDHLKVLSNEKKGGSCLVSFDRYWLGLHFRNIFTVF